jgi:carbonic anhydrase
MKRTLAALLLAASAALAAPAAAQDETLSVCDTTRDQSPINITGAVAAALPPLSAQYRPSPGRLFNNAGHSLQVELEGDNRLLVGGTSYALVQFHTHWPSEHHLEADSFAAEVHYVHVNAEGEPAAVLGTFVRRGAHNAAWERILRLLPGPGVPGLVPLRRVDARALGAIESLDAETIYRYPGSLTTHPSCAGIAWMVRARPIEMSDAQIRLLREKTSRYARPVQPLGDREIRYRRP